MKAGHGPGKERVCVWREEKEILVEIETIAAGERETGVVGLESAPLALRTLMSSPVPPVLWRKK